MLRGFNVIKELWKNASDDISGPLEQKQYMMCCVAHLSEQPSEQTSRLDVLHVKQGSSVQKCRNHIFGIKTSIPSILRYPLHPEHKKIVIGSSMATLTSIINNSWHN